MMIVINIVKWSKLRIIFYTNISTYKPQFVFNDIEYYFYSKYTNYSFYKLCYLNLKFNLNYSEDYK